MLYWCISNYVKLESYLQSTATNTVAYPTYTDLIAATMEVIIFASRCKFVVKFLTSDNFFIFNFTNYLAGTGIRAGIKEAMLFHQRSGDK